VLLFVISHRDGAVSNGHLQDIPAGMGTLQARRFMSTPGQRGAARPVGAGVLLEETGRMGRPASSRDARALPEAELEQADF
jgi:hypothetical protein